MIQGIKPTSKATLKLQCLFATKGDIDEAKKLYDFFADDIASLPDYDPAPQTWVDSTKDVAGGIVKWLGENKNTLTQGYDIIRAMTGNRLPPLSLPLEAAAETPAAPLPPINESV
ncbi:MAG: hypothetical protein IJ615_10660 [Bacteroidaceae bacterium]|nr:hypothetical protein [Bacteroidaceae bacterium]